MANLPEVRHFSGGDAWLSVDRLRGEEVFLNIFWRILSNFL